MAAARFSAEGTFPKTRRTSNRRAFADRPEKAVPAPPLKIFVFGGSQGAHQLNEHVPEALSRLRKKSVEIFHQTGEAERELVEARYAEVGLPAEVVGCRFECRGHSDGN